MDWSPDNWLAPSHVETPNVVEAIAKYVDPRVDTALYDGMDVDTCYKLRVLAERLEFIDHLSTISARIMTHRRATTSHMPLTGNKVKVVETYSAVINGHDFAGFDYDSDALIIYLLLTCVDTVKGQTKYVNPFHWLKGRCSPGEQINWDDLSLEYERDYGLSKRFRQAFTQDCFEPLRDALVADFAVVKIAGQKIKPESTVAWENRSPAEQVERIASELYSIRSGFTHVSSRSFSPATPVFNALDAGKSVLIQRVGGRSLRELLQNIVRNLAAKLLVDVAMGPTMR